MGGSLGMSQSCLQQQHRDAAAAHAAASYPYMFHHDPLGSLSYGRSCGATQSSSNPHGMGAGYGSGLHASGGAQGKN